MGWDAVAVKLGSVKGRIDGHDAVCALHAAIVEPEVRHQRVLVLFRGLWHRAENCPQGLQHARKCRQCSPAVIMRTID